MIPGRILTRLRPFLPWIGGALVLFALFVWADHRGYNRARVKYEAQIARDTAATAKRYADAAGAMLATERRQAAITREQSDAHEARYTALLARYSLRDKNRLPGVPAPGAFSATACKSDAAAGSDGLLGISTEAAAALMFHADANTLQLIDLQRWVAAQTAEGGE